MHGFTHRRLPERRSAQARKRAWSPARIVALALALSAPVLVSAGNSAAQAVQPLPELEVEPGVSTLSAPTPATSATGPTTPVLDAFDRPNEDPLSQGGQWASHDPRGSCCSDLLEVFSNQAAALDNDDQNISYRPLVYASDLELYATVEAKPGIGRSLTLVFNIRQIGPFSWDGFYLAWHDREDTDVLRISRIIDNEGGGHFGTAEFEMSVGDKLLARRIGTRIEGWVFHEGSWSLAVTGEDSSLLGGMVGLAIVNTSGRWDDFGAGSFVPPPPSTGPPPEQSHGICTGTGVHAHSTSRCLSDPVNTLTGAFVTQVEDIALSGTGVSFDWSRSYTSSDPTVGRLGPGWTDSYATSLRVEPSGDVVLHGDEGQQVRYTKQGDGSFVGAPGSLSTLTQITGGYRLVRKDQVVYLFDTQGRLLSMKDRNEQGVTLAYDGSNRLAALTDAANRQATVSYNGQGLVSQVRTQDGRSVSYGYAAGRLAAVTDVRGKTWMYTYDAAGRLRTSVDPLGHTQVTNVYGSDGRVASQTDAVGATTTFSWNAETQVATVTSATGPQWRHDYEDGVLVAEIVPYDKTELGSDNDLNMTSVTSPAGDTTTMTYDAAGNLLTATAPASLGGVRKTFVYNARNDPTRITDARDIVTSFSYDAKGNPETVTQAGTRIASYTYDDAGRALTFTDGNEKTSTYTYFPATGYLASSSDPLGNTTTYTYDPAGRVLTRVDPKGNVPGCNCAAEFTWRYSYDEAGQQLTETDPLGHTTTNVYDDAGRTTSTKDALNRTTSYTYDDANRVLTQTAPDPDGTGPLSAPVTTYTYDGVGNNLTETDPRGHTTTFHYDKANRVINTVAPDPDGAGPLRAPQTTQGYDQNGNVASTVEPRGNVAGSTPSDYRTTYAYDAAGRLLTTTDPLGSVTTNVYDPVGNLQSVQDANNHVTSYSYDAAGRILAVTAPDLGVTTYSYDDAGNLRARTDDNGHTTTFAYDDAGALVSETTADPDGPGPQVPAVTSYTYDPNGNRLTVTDPNGNASPASGDGVTTYGYDRANRQTSIDHSDATPDVNFTYDAVGNRLSMTDGSGTETRTYDALDRVLTVARGSNTFLYAYDAASNVTRRTYPDNTIVDHTYDPLNRLATVQSGSQTTSYAYDTASNPTQTTLPSGSGYVESRVYDRAGRLTEVKNQRGSTVLSQFVSTLDPVGNPTQIVRTGALAQAQTYTYDANDRLLSVCFLTGPCPGASDPFIRWTYDKVGNRLTEQRPTGTTPYFYDARDRLLSAGSTSFAYDQNGNQTQKDSRTFTYDLANRLQTTRLGSTTTTYSYDGDGKRLQTSTGSSSSQKTNFLWDVSFGLPQVARENSGSGSLLRRYLYGERRISMTTGSNTNYYHYDPLGSVANTSSSSGSTRWTYTYEPFGQTRSEQPSGDGAPTNFMRFTGEYLDPTGLYHLRARQYDPGTGRFLRSDPAEPHLHSPLIASHVYTANRPTVLVDPSGEVFRRVDDHQQAAHASVSVVDWQSPFLCRSPFCGGRRPQRLVYPIPKRFPSRLVTFPSDPIYGMHPTANAPGYPAIDFKADRQTPVIAVENGRVREFTSAIGGEGLYFRGDSGVDYFYAHIRSRGVSRDERVQAGGVIAVVAPLSSLDHLHLGANANFGGRIEDRKREGTDDPRDPATQRAQAIIQSISRAPRV